MPMTPTLAELLKGSRPNYQSEPTYRMSMLPFGTYANPDGSESLGLALPGMIHEPLMAVERLFGSGNFAKGPDAPGNADDMRTLLFSMYGGNALSPGRLMEGAAAHAAPEVAARALPERPNFGQPTQAASYYNGEMFTGRNHGDAYNQAVARYGEDAVDDMILRDGMQDGFVDAGGNFMDRMTANELSGGKGLNAYELLSDTGRPSIMGAALAGADGQPVRAYRGTPTAEELIPIGREGETPKFWASSSPDTAMSYSLDPAHEYRRYKGAVAPVDMNFENPMTVDAQGSMWNNIPFGQDGLDRSTTMAIANHAQGLGHDGLIIKNVRDAIGPFENSASPADTYAALKRGTVTSPLTGETLFSDTGKPSLMGSAIASQDQKPPTLSQILSQRAGSM